MRELDKLKKVLNPSIEISTTSLSYVNKLFPEFKGLPYIILHKKQPFPESLKNDNNIECADEVEATQFDITGSPLKYSFDEDEFEDTIILIKQNWLKEEERYLPLDRAEACNSLNLCLENISSNCHPILALCDGKDSKETKLLGTIIRNEWFTTIEVCSTGIETFATIKNSSSMFLQDHLKLSGANEYDINISACNTFDLFGTREEMINWKENVKANYEGSLSVEVDTRSLSLHPPTRASKNNMIMQLVTGSRSSPLKELWKQLLLLNQYLTIIEEYTKNVASQNILLPLEFPDGFKTPYEEDHDKIMKNISSLLNEDYSYRNCDNIDLHKADIINDESIETGATIEQYIQNLPFRHNLSFIDFFWELLIKNRNCLEMTKCIRTVFEEIASGGYLTQVNFTNVTRFAKVMSNLHTQETITHLLSGSLPLEYLVDMGFEKLCKDYMFILANARFSEVHDLQGQFLNLSSGEFNIDNYRKRLISMAQVHICLEFMLLVQNNLGCPTEHLKSIFSCAFKKFKCDESPIKSHYNLDQNTIYSLSAPLPISMITDLNKGYPSTRRISLLSKSKLSQLNTIKYYSELPIFPTNICSTGDTTTTDETYHVITVTCSSNKFK